MNTDCACRGVVVMGKGWLAIGQIWVRGSVTAANEEGGPLLNSCPLFNLTTGARRKMHQTIFHCGRALVDPGASLSPILCRERTERRHGQSSETASAL